MRWNKSTSDIKNYVTLCVILLIYHSPLHAHPFLWKVTGENEFYMFGTIHLPDPRVTHLPEEVKQALENSTALYTELDLSESNTMMIKQSMWLPEKKNLTEYLSPKQEKDINQYLQQVNPELNLGFFVRQKIWVLAITLTVLEQQLKSPDQSALDKVLYEQAILLGLDTGGLESAEEQMQVFEAMTIKEQLKFLDDTLEYMKSTKAYKYDFIEESINAYLEGDLDLLMTNLMSYMKDEPFYEKLLVRLIDQRNVKIVDTMLALAKSHPAAQYFFAVGVGHFWGDKGIDSLLTEKGYKIQVVE